MLIELSIRLYMIIIIIIIYTYGAFFPNVDLGVWFLHGHLERSLHMGVFIVQNGKGPDAMTVPTASTHHDMLPC